MYKYLEFKSDKSNKFWEVHRIDTSVTTRYGKIGTKGTSKEKRFQSAEEAEKETTKLLSQKLKKGYEESQFHTNFVANIDRMMTILFEYEASDPDIQLGLSRPEETDLVPNLPLSYLYLVRTYGTINFFDMYTVCYQLDFEDFDHDDIGEEFEIFFKDVMGFQFSGGPNCIDSYAFKLDTENGNSERDIASFSHDDEWFISKKDFTDHILDFFFRKFDYYYVLRDGKTEDTFRSIESALAEGRNPKKPE